MLSVLIFERLLVLQSIAAFSPYTYTIAHYMPKCCAILPFFRNFLHFFKNRLPGAVCGRFLYAFILHFIPFFHIAIFKVWHTTFQLTN